jgi:hypothetical protein
MTGDIALAGFVLTEEEWQAFEPVAREQLIAAAAAAARRDDGRIAAPLAVTGSARTGDEPALP